MKLLFINGVNLNMTGLREPELYGSQTLEQINEMIKEHFALDVCHFFQSNIEGEICTALQDTRGSDYEGIVLNAGAYSHYSIAIRDAISCTDVPVVEVHMSNIYAREQFRHTSVLSAVCKGCVVGFGAKGYILAGESFKK